MRPHVRVSALACVAMIAATPTAAAAQQNEIRPAATSLLGRPLFTPPLDSATAKRLRGDLEKALADLAASPDDADRIIWVARRHGYLGEYEQAIRVLSDGIRKFPNDARMYRHRGHRYITLRRFAAAVSDLEKAAALMAGKPDEVEPDGQPNARNIPIGSLQSNVWYHLALAYYLQGDWNNAIRASREGIAVSSNPDRLVSQTHWLYMALRNADRDADAARALLPIRDDFDIIENHSYYRLVRLYRTGIPRSVLDSLVSVAAAGTPSDASLAYGIANWFLYTGDTTAAVRAMERIIESPQWASFGVIAAEADLARLRRRR